MPRSWRPWCVRWHPPFHRLDGRGYHGLKTEIDGWVATMNRLLANKRRAHGTDPSFQKSIRRISYLSSIW